MPEDCQNDRNMLLMLMGQIKLYMFDRYTCVSCSMIHRNGAIAKNKVSTAYRTGSKW